jgi:beta-lactamase class A
VLKSAKLQPAGVTVMGVTPADGNQLLVQLVANATAPLVVMEAPGVVGSFSDNAMTMLAGREYALTFTPKDKTVSHREGVSRDGMSTHGTAILGKTGAHISHPNG